MAFDAHKNFAYSTLSNSPGTGGTSLIVQSGEGALFPTPPFNATVWPAGEQPSITNAEIVRVDSISTDTFTVTRNTPTETVTGINRNMTAGDQIAATITAKTLTDIEANYGNSWAPFLMQTGTGVQSLASSNQTNNSRTGSMLFFPMTLQAPVKFNQLIIGDQLSYVTSNQGATMQATYISKFGIFSRANATLYSLISSNSFSIGITDQSVSLSMNFPTTTHTSGYGYGSLGGTGLTATAQRASFLDGTRAIGLQFGGEMSLSGARYWVGLLHYKYSTSGLSTHGLSNVGVVGQIINPWNMPGIVSGPPQIGRAPQEFANLAFTDTAWYGRHIIGFLTNTARNDYAGTAIPPRIWMAELAAATNSILPNITLVST
ncbi:hypothetical protein E6Q11_01245 [Candidatus Dojkabacteria bacterium]|uniref:Uncharacterized protein n=1 Tax=Candidatus Dojkabacteria bacterium TaxID=2099670 RepID=A0A5C7JCW5_9BACT|nr:MAG: hypothetical protein E6Q11_01245 [Candidatus Dojkabacteria bacterium]